MNDPLPPTTRRGRRSSAAAPDIGVSEKFIEEVLSFTDGELPEVDPTRARTKQAGVGAFVGFAVFGDPVGAVGAGDEPVDDGMVKPARSSAINRRDTASFERPDFYEDTANATAAHSVRFRPGRTMSIGHRTVFRANDHGVPIFSPGWDAAMVTKRNIKKSLALLAASAMAVVASGALIFFGVGTDSHYQSMLKNGTEVVAVVGAVTSDTTGNIEKDPNALGRDAKTTEKAAIEFALAGKQHQQQLTKVTTGEAAMTGTKPTWVSGEKVLLLVDPADVSKFVKVNPDARGPVSWITLSPLVPAAALLVGSGASLVTSRKMLKITRSK